MCCIPKDPITRCWTHAVLCLGWLNIFWMSGGGENCKGCAVPPAYTQSCPAVICGVLQLWKRRITKWCTLSTASTKLSISGRRGASSLPYLSLCIPSERQIHQNTNSPWLRTRRFTCLECRKAHMPLCTLYCRFYTYQSTQWPEGAHTGKNTQIPSLEDTVPKRYTVQGGEIHWKVFTCEDVT